MSTSDMSAARERDEGDATPALRTPSPAAALAVAHAGERAPEAAAPLPTAPVAAAHREAALPAVAVAAATESAAALDPAVAALCVPMSAADPCGPDLDFDGDAGYLNFFASVESLLPSSFFKKDPNNPQEDGKPFDQTTIDLPRQLQAIKPLLERTRDIRLLVMQARLLILNRDLGGFAVTLAAIAEWLDKFWDAVHPRAQGGDLGARVAALGSLDLPTVVFPLQYAPLYDARRIGAVTYRAWMIASGAVKPRPGEQKHDPGAVTEAMAVADPAVLAASRRHVATLKSSLGRIRNVFALQGSFAVLENLPGLVERISAFIDPHAGTDDKAAEDAETTDGAAAETASKDGARSVGGAPTSLAEAGETLMAVADYYSRLEPSSPTLPLVRQAHQLIGKSFIEVMSILVPTQMDKAAFQIGADQVFELPVGRLSKLSEAPPAAAQPAGAVGPGQPGNSPPHEAAVRPRYRVESRSQAIALLEQVQRFFRRAEPSSPVPMLCDRARALAERDFMGVLRDVLPKTALKNAGADK